MLINKQQAAAILGISPFSMNRMMKIIPFVRVSPRRVLFDTEDLASYIESKKVVPKSRPGKGGPEIHPGERVECQPQ